MSISAPLAVTMMMGTFERARMARQTSIPESLGSIMSSSTMSGLVSSKSWRASRPSRATVTLNPSWPSPTTRASTKDSSSSAKRTVTGRPSVVTPGAPLRGVIGSRQVLGVDRQHEGERRPLALA